jgi:hypothetical protein
MGPGRFCQLTTGEHSRYFGLPLTALERGDSGRRAAIFEHLFDPKMTRRCSGYLR